MLVESMYFQSGQKIHLALFGFMFCFSRRRNVSVTGYTIWLFVVGFFVNYVTVNTWV